MHIPAFLWSDKIWLFRRFFQPRINSKPLNIRCRTLSLVLLYFVFILLQWTRNKKIVHVNSLLTFLHCNFLGPYHCENQEIWIFKTTLNLRYVSSFLLSHCAFKNIVLIEWNFYIWQVKILLHWSSLIIDTIL